MKRETQHLLYLPVATNKIPYSFRWLFLWAPCRCRFDRNYIRISCPVSKKTGHFAHPFFAEIVSDIAVVGMGAGEACPCVAESTQPTAIVAFRAFYRLFLVFH